MKVAVIDIGSNTARLLVAAVDGSDVTQLRRERQYLRLGDDVHALGRIGPRKLKAANEEQRASRSSLGSRARNSWRRSSRCLCARRRTAASSCGRSRRQLSLPSWAWPARTKVGWRGTVRLRAWKFGPERLRWWTSVAKDHGITNERAQTLLGGTLALAEIARRLESELEVGRGGLREGAALAIARAAALAA